METLLDILKIALVSVIAVEIRDYLTSGSTIRWRTYRKYHAFRWWRVRDKLTYIKIEAKWSEQSQSAYSPYSLLSVIQTPDIWRPGVRTKHLKEEIWEWIENNCKGKVGISTTHPVSVCFTNPNDAVLFKVKWS